MAVTRRGYIFSTFLLSVLCVLLVVFAVSSDSWITSSATAQIQQADSHIQYGLFGGEFVQWLLVTPFHYTLYMTCLPDLNACAVSCKLEEQARRDEVSALAEGLRPNPSCTTVTTINEGTLDTPPVISFAFYVCFLVAIFAQLLFALASAGLAIINATKNPTEPVFGLPGCLWANVMSALLGLIVLMMFGIYYATSGLNEHLAMAYVALEEFIVSPTLGYSYWLILGAILCSLANVGLIQLRKYLLERDPPPPTIKVESHSDGTIFLY